MVFEALENRCCVVAQRCACVSKVGDVPLNVVGVAFRPGDDVFVE